MSTRTPYSPTATILATAKREIHVLARTKSIWVSLGIQLLVIIGLSALLGWQAGRDGAEAPRLAVVGVDAAAFEGSAAQIAPATDRAAAERGVRDGEAEAAVVATGNGWELLTDGKADPAVSALVSSAASAHATNAALDALNVSPEQFAAATPDTHVTPVNISPDAAEGESESDVVGLVTTLGVLILIMFTVVIFAANVGSRVATEKSSRVVEIILAAVRPFDFLAGKILGNVAMSFTITAILVATAGAALYFSDVADSVDIEWAILPFMFIPWALAMLFFSTLYAAAGAMVQRLEDLQSTQGPILFLVMASMYVPMFGWANTGATWMQVASWIPPVSIFAAPVTYAAGDFSLAQLLGSMFAALLATVVAVWAAARIYRNSILNNGAKATWAKVLRS